MDTPLQNLPLHKSDINAPQQNKGLCSGCLNLLLCTCHAKVCKCENGSQCRFNFGINFLHGLPRRCRSLCHPAIGWKALLAASVLSTMTSITATGLMCWIGCAALEKRRVPFGKHNGYSTKDYCKT